MLTVVSGPDIYLTPLFSTLLAAGLAADAIFQFGYNVLPGRWGGGRPFYRLLFLSTLALSAPLFRSDEIRRDRHGPSFPSLAETQILRRKKKGNLSRHLDFPQTRNLKLYSKGSTWRCGSDVTLILGIVDTQAISFGDGLFKASCAPPARGS